MCDKLAEASKKVYDEKQSVNADKSEKDEKKALMSQETNNVNQHGYNLRSIGIV